MPMPHRTFAQVAKRRLVGKEGRERIREVRALLQELPDYRNGPYADLRKWLTTNHRPHPVEQGHRRAGHGMRLDLLGRGRFDEYQPANLARKLSSEEVGMQAAEREYDRGRTFTALDVTDPLTVDVREMRFVPSLAAYARPFVRGFMGARMLGSCVERLESLTFALDRPLVSGGQ
jgi:hypothetical protein